MRGHLQPDVPLPATISLTAWVVLAPLALGIVVTLLAALVPARAATRVAPVEGLRPSDAPTVTERSSRARPLIAAVLTLGGLGALLAGIPLMRQGLGMLGFGVAVLGGALSFVGVLLGAVFWIPRVVALAGRALQRTGTSARLAAANTARNPRRTAATSTALLIGVTLVSMMSAGAASARVTLGSDLDDHYPVDLSLTAPPAGDGSTGVMPVDAAPKVARVQGVGTVVTLRGTPAPDRHLGAARKPGRLGRPEGDLAARPRRDRSLATATGRGPRRHRRDERRPHQDPRSPGWGSSRRRGLLEVRRRADALTGRAVRDPDSGRRRH